MTVPVRFRPWLFLLVPALVLSPVPRSLIPVVSAQWQPDVRLSYSGDAYTSYNNAWCVAANGDAVYVVWYYYDFLGGDVFCARSGDGGATWEPATHVTYYPLDSWCPSVAVSGSRVHVAWADYRDGNEEVYYKYSPDGGTTWGPDGRLTYDPSDSWCPSLAVSGSDVYVVWWDGWGSSEIYCLRSTNGGDSWQPAVRLTNDPATSWAPSAAAWGSDVHVVWAEARDGNFEIYYKRSTDAGQTWEEDQRLTRDPAESNRPSVAVSGLNVHVVWIEARDGNGEIYYKHSTDAGVTWGPDIRLTSDPHGSTWPSIAVSGSRVHVAWVDDRDGNEEIYYRRSNDGGLTWEPETRLTEDAGESDRPSIAVSGSRVHVAWHDDRSGNRDVYYKRNLTGNVAAVAVQLNCLTPTIPRGGRLQYRVTFTNNTSGPQAFRYWSKVKLPNGTWFGEYLVPPTSVSLNPYESRTYPVRHTVPRHAPLGPYEYWGYVGSDTTMVWDLTSFPFTVTVRDDKVGIETLDSSRSLWKSLDRRKAGDP